MKGESISGELRRKSIAASTIREALADFVVEERDRIVSKLAAAATTAELITVQVDARAYMKLRNELERAISRGNPEDE